MITLFKSILQNDSKVKHQIHTIKEPSVEDQYQQQYQHQFDSELNTCKFQSQCVRARELNHKQGLKLSVKFSSVRLQICTSVSTNLHLNFYNQNFK